MNDSDRSALSSLYIIIAILISIFTLLLVYFYTTSHYDLKQTSQWGGSLPMEVYTIYDRDTGVYYAVTEKGGICVMQTMSGETKLVEQGEPPIIHKNKGE